MPKCGKYLLVKRNMARQLVSKWRESASLIVLAKDKALQNAVKCDYKVLLFNRTEKASFMPNSAVFPGGVHETVDGAAAWLEHFQNFGITDERLKGLTDIKGPRPKIFTKPDTECLPKEISLRITAIRETFEEMGILICRHRNKLDNVANSNFGDFIKSDDKKTWQKLVHNDATKFLTLCRELDVMPDLWNLHEWSTWLSPSSFKKRFETAFFMVGLHEIPEVLLEENEAACFSWKTPADFLTSYAKKEIWLPPPQFYELSRLLNFDELQKLLAFAKSRSEKGSTLMLPVQRKCKDGMVSLMPGDDMYPADPNATHEIELTEQTFEQYRSKDGKLNRVEYFTMHNAHIQLNFPYADGHLAPINIKKE